MKKTIENDKNLLKITKIIETAVINWIKLTKQWNYMITNR